MKANEGIKRELYALLFFRKGTTMETTASISGAMEEYLETIYILSRKKPTVRITDIAAHLGISKPSANRAVNSLKNRGLVFHEPYGDIMLTPQGERLGHEFYDRHKMIMKFLTSVLEVPSDIAETDASSIEHDLSRDTVERMMKYMNN